MELAMAKGFEEMSSHEMINVNGGELYQDADDANLAALVFAVGAIVVGGPLASVYGVMAAYAYYEAATGDYEDPAGVAPYVSGDGISSGGRVHSGGSKRF